MHFETRAIHAGGEVDEATGAVAPPILLYKLSIGIGGLGILIEKFHITVGRSAIHIVVIFFDILTVVAFFACQSKESLFKDRVTSVPEDQRKTHLLMARTHHTGIHRLENACASSLAKP